MLKKRRHKKLKKIIDNTASKFISETLDKLNEKEKRFSNIGTIWNVIGFISIILGIALVILTQIKNYNSNIEIAGILIVSIRNLILIALLIAASKYAFNLSKLYMNESLKISNRIHAISFGEFYLKVNQNIEPAELKEIFSNWNIDKNSAFLDNKLDDYDPNLIDKISKLLKEIKNNAQSSR